MAIKITREEYEKKFGQAPNLASSQKTQEKPSTFGTFTGPLREGISGLGTLYGGSENGIANKLKQDVVSGAEDYSKGNYVKGTIKAAARTAGDVAGAIFAPIGAGIGATGAGKVFDSIGKGISDFSHITDHPAVQEFAMKHPNASEDFGRALNLIFARGEKGKIEPSTAIERTQGQLNAVKDATINAGQSVVNGVKNVKNGVKNVKDSATSNLKPENIMQRVARVSKGEQAKFEQTSGESVGSYLTKRGIYGNTEQIITKLYDRFNQSKGAVDEALGQLVGEHQPAPVKDALSMLVEREKSVATENVKSPEFNRIMELNNKFENRGLTHSEINEIKRIFERKVRLDFVKENKPQGVETATNVDNAIREWQFKQAEYQGLKNLPVLNKETQSAKRLMDALGKENAGSGGNNLIPLSDTILMASGDPSVIGLYLAKKLISSKRVQSAIAKKRAGNPTVDSPTAQFRKLKSGSLELPAPTTIYTGSAKGYSGPIKPSSYDIAGAQKATGTYKAPQKPLALPEGKSKIPTTATNIPTIKLSREALSTVEGREAIARKLEAYVKKLREGAEQLRLPAGKGEKTVKGKVYNVKPIRLGSGKK